MFSKFGGFHTPNFLLILSMPAKTQEYQSPLTFLYGIFLRTIKETVSYLNQCFVSPFENTL